MTYHDLRFTTHYNTKNESCWVHYSYFILSRECNLHLQVFHAFPKGNHVFLCSFSI
jgi:hypothetical protein